MPKNLGNRPGGKHITEVAQLAASGYEDIRPAHRAVFHSISPEGSRIMELAERVPMTKQSWEALVEYLRERGSVERHPDPSEARAKNVRLTERSQRWQPTALQLSHEIDRDGTGLIGENEMRRLRRVLEHLYGAL